MSVMKKVSEINFATIDAFESNKKRNLSKKVLKSLNALVETQVRKHVSYSLKSLILTGKIFSSTEVHQQYCALETGIFIHLERLK